MIFRTSFENLKIGTTTSQFSIHRFMIAVSAEFIKVCRTEEFYCFTLAREESAVFRNVGVVLRFLSGPSLPFVTIYLVFLISFIILHLFHYLIKYILRINWRISVIKKTEFDIRFELITNISIV